MATRSDPRFERIAERRLMTAMALAIIATMAILGFVYLALWVSAADDLTRLLPASTRAYAAAPAPWASATRALGLPIWRDKAALEAAVLRDGYLAGERQGEIAGLPVETVRALVRTMDSIEVALVPTSEGDTLLVFIELRDTTQRKRALARLAPLLETVDRRVGFRVDKVRRRPWQVLVGSDIEPPRVVDMEPWIVIAWGAPGGLDDLLEARVAGRGSALYKRSGFDLRPEDEGDGRLAVDASSAWRLLAGAGEPRPGGLVEYLDLLTVEARVTQASDVLSLRAEITDRELTNTLRAGLMKAPHPLAARAPDDALFVLSATGRDLPSLVAVLRTLVFRLRRDFLPSSEIDATVADLLAAAADLPVAAGEPPFATEIVLIGLPHQGDPNGQLPTPLVLLRSPRIEEVAAHLAGSVPERFGDAYAHGEVLHRGETVYLELLNPSESDIEGSRSTERPSPDIEASPRLAWRLRDRLIELAPDVATLDRFAATTGTIGDSPRFDAARRGLPRASAILWMADRRLLDRRDGPLVDLVADRLRADYSFGATLDVSESHLTLHSNLGLWTLATALASASRAEIDALTLSDLDPRCRAAYEAFCTLYPDAVPCRPFSIGRRGRIDAVCRALLAKTEDGR